MSPIIDSHCHLTDPRLLGQVDDVLARARAAGVGPVITIGCGPADSRQALALADRFADVFAAIAVHPHNAGECTEDTLAEIERMLAGPACKIVAVGEIGMDYHYDFAPRDAQRAVFEAQVRTAARLNLPVVIHSRDSIADALAIIQRVRADLQAAIGSSAATDSGTTVDPGATPCLPTCREQGVPGSPTHLAPGEPGDKVWHPSDHAGGAVRGVFHSFTGSPDEADAVVAAGFFISLSGIVTFKKSTALQAAARRIPADRLLIETDAPYLSPEPVRGMKVNEPANLVHTLAALAAIRGESPAELAEQTRANTIRLFNLPTMP